LASIDVRRFSTFGLALVDVSATRLLLLCTCDAIDSNKGPAQASMLGDVLQSQANDDPGLDVDACAMKHSKDAGPAMALASR